MESDPRWGYPGGSPNTWHSPRYRGGGGGQRFRGNSEGSFTPRQNWRGQGQWTPSPYRGGGGGYRPNYRNSSPYTPRRGSPGFGYQEPYRQRNPHSSPRFHSTPYNQNDIENWVSPQMWQDPWADLMPQPYQADSKMSIQGAETYTPAAKTPDDQKQEPNSEQFTNLDESETDASSVYHTAADISTDTEIPTPSKVAEIETQEPTNGNSTSVEDHQSESEPQL